MGKNDIFAECQLSGILLFLVDQKTNWTFFDHITQISLFEIFVSATKQFKLNSLSVVFKVESYSTVFHGRHIYILSKTIPVDQYI